MICRKRKTGSNRRKQNMAVIDEKWLEETWQKTEAKLSRIAVSLRGTIPYTTDENKKD